MTTHRLNRFGRLSCLALVAAGVGVTSGTAFAYGAAPPQTSAKVAAGGGGMYLPWSSSTSGGMSVTNLGPTALGQALQADVSVSVSGGDAKLGTFQISGGTPGEFKVTGTTCPQPGTLKNGSRCAVSVKFTPAGTGERSAILNLNHSHEGARQIKLIADVARDDQGALLVLGSDDRPAYGGADFGLPTSKPMTQIGQAVQRTLKFKNVGKGTLDLSYAVAPDNGRSAKHAADFALDGSCGKQLQGGQTCEMKVAFKPQYAGAYRAELLVSAPGSLYPQVDVGLTASVAVPSGAAAVQLDHGSNQDGKEFHVTVKKVSGGASYAAVRNVGKVPVTLDWDVVANGAKYDFTPTTNLARNPHMNCQSGRVLKAGETCTLKVMSGNVAYYPAGVKVGDRLRNVFRLKGINNVWIDQGGEWTVVVDQIK